MFTPLIAKDKMLSPFSPQHIPPPSQTWRSVGSFQVWSGSIQPQMSSLPGCLSAASPTCQNLGFFLQLPIKRTIAGLWVAAWVSLQRLSASSSSRDRCFLLQFCCCWWGDSLGSCLDIGCREKKLNPKGRERRRRSWSSAGSMGWTQHPLAAALWQGTGCGHRRVGRAQPVWKHGWSRNKEVLPADGFSESCHEFFSRGKTSNPERLLLSKVCFSPGRQAARGAS